MYKNLLLLAVSICLSLLLGEGLARLSVDPSDFLAPLLVTHPQFGRVAYPNSGDRWGYRNSSVPQHADLLAIGDSFTYGENTPREENWPSVAARRAKLAVYNVSVGGWGPTQYLCSARVYGHALQPKLVVVGIYLGNDIVQAATQDYPCTELDPDRISAGYELLREDGKEWPIRTWLSRRSVLYQLIKLELDASKWFRTLAHEGRKDYQRLVQFRGQDVVLMDRRLPSHDLFAVGIKKTIVFLQGIEEECAQLKASCYTVTIPSKEAVYYKLLRNAIPEDWRKNLEQTWINEQAAIEEISNAFAFSKMTVMDPSAELERAIMERTQIYPPSVDPHFKGAGHRVIGLFVAARVTKIPAE